MYRGKTQNNKTILSGTEITPTSWGSKTTIPFIVGNTQTAEKCKAMISLTQEIKISIQPARQGRTLK